MIIQQIADVSVNCLDNSPCETGLPQINASDSNVHTILQLSFGVIGAIAVIMIVVAALQLVNANGKPEEAATARRTIMYALIGLVIAVSAESIVTFVLTGF